MGPEEVCRYRGSDVAAASCAGYSRVHSSRTELNRTDLHQVDPVTRRVIGQARQRHEDAALQFANCGSVQVVCCEHGLTPLLLGVGCVLSQMTTGAESRPGEFTMQG